MDNRPSLAAGMIAPIMLGFLLWIALMAAKALGAPLRISWLALGLGVFWIPLALTALLFLVLIVLNAARSVRRKLGIAAKHRRMKRAVNSIVEKMTLNGVGEAFGVERIRLPLYMGPEPEVRLSSFSALDDAAWKGKRVVEVEGALTDRLLQKVKGALAEGEMELVVGDFTKVFCSQELYRAFVRRGGRLSVRMKSELLAVCVNPVAPNGIVLDSDILCRELSQRIGLPVYDIVKNEYEI